MPSATLTKGSSASPMASSAFLRFMMRITDQHFVTRNRFGRTAVFMARQIADGKVQHHPLVVLGVAVDEATGIVVDKHGIGTLLLQGKGGSAFLIRGGPAKRILPKLPFVSAALTVTKLSKAGDRFDFKTWCGQEPTYDVRVNGSRPYHQIYSPRDPYDPPPEAAFRSALAKNRNARRLDRLLVARDAVILDGTIDPGVQHVGL